MNGILILTAVELEAAGLARELELPALAGLPYRAFCRGSTRIVPVGLGAALLSARWADALDGLTDPLVISAGICGGLDLLALQDWHLLYSLWRKGYDARCWP